MKVSELIDILAPLNGDMEVGFILNNQQKSKDIVSNDIENGEDTIFDVVGYERKDIGYDSEAFNFYFNMIDV
jgi:hypothetical protein